MSHRILTRVFLLMCAGIVAGCQMDTAEDTLPPVSLAPPTIIGTPPMAMARQTYVPLPTPVVAPIRPPAAKPALRVSVAQAGSVPAAWIPAVRANHWIWIIVHHSDSDYGSAAIIDQWHRARGFDELGYHFVIGNGTNSGDGQIEVGPRWTKQKWGAHDNALDNRFNTNGIGICLVGDFNKTRPTAAQKRSLIRLVVYLMKKYNIPPDRVLGHGETKDTQCPGKNLHMAEIRAAAERVLAGGDSSPGDSQFADGH